MEYLHIKYSKASALRRNRIFKSSLRNRLTDIFEIWLAMR